MDKKKKAGNRKHFERALRTLSKGAVLDSADLMIIIPVVHCQNLSI